MTIEKDNNLINKPFNYYVIDNFVKEDYLEKMIELYHNLTFKELQSDLFNFCQTEEIESYEIFSKFKKTILSKIESLNLVKYKLDDAFFTIFASYYRKDDHLYCHDDCLDSRVFAFILYLNDFDSGNLILYENDCLTEHTKIIPKKGRFVMFEVSSKSYHEVEKCLKDGRMTITGWVNKSLINEVECKLNEGECKLNEGECECELNNYKSKLSEGEGEEKLSSFIPKNLYFVDFLNNFIYEKGMNKINEIYMGSIGDDINVNILSKIKYGPLISRKCTKLELEENLAPIINNYDLFLYESLCVEDDDYILLNDKINILDFDPLDVFIFFDACDNFLHLVDNETGGDQLLNIPKNHFLYIFRKSVSFYFKKPKNICKFVHMIYKKIK